MIDAYKTGTLIKNSRQKLHLSQQELADKMHISRATVSKWETGKGMPDISLLLPLADCLNLSIAELLKGETVDQTPEMKESFQLLAHAAKEQERHHLAKRTVHTILIIILLFGGILFAGYNHINVMKREIVPISYYGEEEIPAEEKKPVPNIICQKIGDIIVLDMNSPADSYYCQINNYVNKDGDCDIFFWGFTWRWAEFSRQAMMTHSFNLSTSLRETQKIRHVYYYVGFLSRDDLLRINPAKDDLTELYDHSVLLYERRNESN